MQIKTGTIPTGQTVLSSYREISLHVTSERIFPNVLYADLSGKEKYPAAFHIFLRKPSVSWEWDWQQTVGSSHGWHLPVVWGVLGQQGRAWQPGLIPPSQTETGHRGHQEQPWLSRTHGWAEQGCGITGTWAGGPRRLTWAVDGMSETPNWVDWAL